MTKATVIHITKMMEGKQWMKYWVMPIRARSVRPGYEVESSTMTLCRTRMTEAKKTVFNNADHEETIYYPLTTMKYHSCAYIALRVSLYSRQEQSWRNMGGNHIRIVTRVRVIYAKSRSLWSTNPVCLHTKKWSFFSPVIIKIGANFLFLLSSCVILNPEGQVFTACTEVNLRFAFHWGARRAQYRPNDTSSWSNQVFAYRDNGSRPHTVTLSLFQMKWFKLFEYKSNTKIYSSI